MAKQLVVVDGQKLDLNVLADYMNDDLREELNDLGLDDQTYIDTYIERAKEEDNGFIDVLSSEFNVTV